MKLPSSLIQSLKQTAGFHQESFEAVHASGEQITSIRINPAKVKDISALFKEQPLSPVPWCSGAYYLPQRPSFTTDPLFHAGWYYVQEASSMFLEQAMTQSLDLSQPIKALDLCAAPGGKSTLMQSLLSPDSLLLSNEVIKTRVSVLEENLIKWGGINTIISNNDPRDFRRLPGYFDLMVVDAPCSGSGLFRRDPEALKEWSEQNVQLCSQRQQRILADALPSLAEGGVLIYSTCSYSPQENEEVVDWLIKEMGMETLRLKTDNFQGVTESVSALQGYGYRFYPDQIKGEGLFMAVLRNTRSADSIQLPVYKPEKVYAREETILSAWINDPDQLQYIRFKNDILSMPAGWSQDQLSVLSSLYIKRAGISTGAIIHDTLVPDHPLALSTIAHSELPTLHLGEEDALHYLRKENLPTDSPIRGWALVQFKGASLGWVKILPNRINNYYPKEWRVRLI